MTRSTDKRLDQFVIDGPVGSAKTPIVEGVRQCLQQQRYFVETHAPFAEARRNLSETAQYLTVFKLFTSSAQGSREGERLLRQIISKKVTEFQLNLRNSPFDQGVLIFDRHWPTVLCSLEDGPLGNTPEGNELTSKWIEEAPPSIFVHTSAEIIKQASGFDPRIPWLSSDEAIEKELARRKRDFQKHRSRFLGNDIFIHARRVDLEPLVDDISSRIRKCIDQR